MWLVDLQHTEIIGMNIASISVGYSAELESGSSTPLGGMPHLLNTSSCMRYMDRR